MAAGQVEHNFHYSQYFDRHCSRQGGQLESARKISTFDICRAIAGFKAS